MNNETERLQYENERIQKRVFELELLLEDLGSKPSSTTIYEPLFEPKGKTPQLILGLLDEDQTLTRRELQALSGRNISTVYRTVNYLQDNGFIERIGTRNTGQWRIFHKEDKMRLLMAIKQLEQVSIGGAAWYSPTMSFGYSFAKDFWGLNNETPLLEYSHDENLSQRVLDLMCAVFGWGILEHQLLEWLQQFSPLEELGAGLGYNARLMKDIGIDIIASDIDPPQGLTWFPVEKKSYNEWCKDSERMPILIWPYDKVLHEWILDDAAPYRILVADNTSMQDWQTGWSTRYTLLSEHYQCIDWYDSTSFTLCEGTSAKLWERRLA